MFGEVVSEERPFPYSPTTHIATCMRNWVEKEKKDEDETNRWEEEMEEREEKE